MGVLFSGKHVTFTEKSYRDKKGGLLKIENPDSKVNTVPIEALREIQYALKEIEDEETFTFIVFYGSEGKIHAGADLTMFEGDIDAEAVHKYLMAGTNLDLKIKEISRRKRTVSILQGERYGGSVEWPLMAEFSVCTPEAGIQLSEINIGLIPGWNGVLNVLLRSNKENALYMAITGDRVNSSEMLESGLVSEVGPKDSILDTALKVAIKPQVKSERNIRTFATEDEIKEIITLRMDSERYRELIHEATRKLEKGELSFQKGDKHYIGKFIGEKLNSLGSPIAPLAADSIFKLINQYPNLSRDNLDLIKKMAHFEADLCFKLMDTLDRKTGVNSVLTNNPLERIPVYVGK